MLEEMVWKKCEVLWGVAVGRQELRRFHMEAFNSLFILSNSPDVLEELQLSL